MHELKFKHAGDIGDIIYSLPVVRAFGGGEFLIEAANYTRTILTPNNWHGIDRILSAQPYISNVREWRYREPVNVNLNDFRAALFKSVRVGQQRDKALVDWMLDTHRIPREAKNDAWLTIEKNHVADVVINRTGPGRISHHVYHNWMFPWRRVYDKYASSAVFIGTKEEHESFCATIGEIKHHKTADLFEAAMAINGAKLFIGNQSACHAIAEGLKKSIVLEVWPEGPNCLHFRDGVYHGWDQKVILPNI